MNGLCALRNQHATEVCVRMCLYRCMREGLLRWRAYLLHRTRRAETQKGLLAYAHVHDGMGARGSVQHRRVCTCACTGGCVSAWTGCAIAGDPPPPPPRLGESHRGMPADALECFESGACAHMHHAEACVRMCLYMFKCECLHWLRKCMSHRMRARFAHTHMCLHAYVHVLSIQRRHVCTCVSRGFAQVLALAARMPMMCAVLLLHIGACLP